MNSIFLYLFLILFPFGQIIRIGILQPIDLIVGMAAAYSILKKQKVPDFFRYLLLFLLFAGISWIFSIFIFHQTTLFYGLLYLIRLAAYFYFSTYVWNFVQDNKKNKKLILDALLGVSIASAAFGWIQFYMFPSLKPFFVWGWDEHLYRLVGTFLDPTFLGLVIVFGLILSMNRFIDSRKVGYLLITFFLIISLAFTYSRASYLAFFAAIIAIGFWQNAFRKYLLLIVAFIVLMMILPTSKNHILSFTRQFSAIARIENYKTTLKIFSKSPVFGIGYDNMCIAYQKYIGLQDFSSHACSGSDSSLLFILATTGIAGFIVFIFCLKRIWDFMVQSKNAILLLISFIALLIHSLFSNSMFYPWILGWMMILLAEV